MQLAPEGGQSSGLAWGLTLLQGVVGGQNCTPTEGTNRTLPPPSKGLRLRSGKTLRAEVTLQIHSPKVTAPRLAGTSRSHHATAVFFHTALEGGSDSGSHPQAAHQFPPAPWVSAQHRAGSVHGSRQWQEAAGHGQVQSLSGLGSQRPPCTQDPGAGSKIKAPAGREKTASI